jgi:hypothetical protein
MVFRPSSAGTELNPCEHFAIGYALLHVDNRKGASTKRRRTGFVRLAQRACMPRCIGTRPVHSQRQGRRCQRGSSPCEFRSRRSNRLSRQWARCGKTRSLWSASSRSRLMSRRRRRGKSPRAHASVSPWALFKMIECVFVRERMRGGFQTGCAPPHSHKRTELKDAKAGRTRR